MRPTCEAIKMTTTASNKINHSISLLGAAMCLMVALVVLTQSVGAMQLMEQVDQGRSSSPGSSSSGGQTGSATLAVVENPEIVVRVLESLLRSIVYSTQADYQQLGIQSAQKRGLDLGISRGFSGSQAGKHLMGLSAASFANGPGRK